MLYKVSLQGIVYDTREGGKEIDQEKFENAVGVQGIEQLVGVRVQENREGWKFWTRAKG